MARVDRSARPPPNIIDARIGKTPFRMRVILVSREPCGKAGHARAQVAFVNHSLCNQYVEYCLGEALEGRETSDGLAERRIRALQLVHGDDLLHAPENVDQCDRQLL